MRRSPKDRDGYVPHSHYHAHPGVEGHDHEHPLVGHHYAPFGNRVVEVPDAAEPDYTLVLKASIDRIKEQRP